MTYASVIEEKCKRTINKACRKNPLLRKIIENKITEIIINPHHYKPLKYDLAGERRVHIMKNQVLKFRIDEQNKTVIFFFFGHHDEAFRR